MPRRIKAVLTVKHSISMVFPITKWGVNTLIHLLMYENIQTVILIWTKYSTRNDMLKMLNAPETFFTICLQGLAVAPLFFPPISAFLIFLRFVVTNVSHQNTTLIRHPIFVTGLFVTSISLSKQCRQTVSVSGRTRPFLSSYVHIHKQQWRRKIEASVVLQICDRAEIKRACSTNTVLEQFVHLR